MDTFTAAGEGAKSGLDVLKSTAEAPYAQQNAQQDALQKMQQTALNDQKIETQKLSNLIAKTGFDESQEDKRKLAEIYKQNKDKPLPELLQLAAAYKIGTGDVESGAKILGEMEKAKLAEAKAKEQNITAQREQLAEAANALSHVQDEAGRKALLDNMDPKMAERIHQLTGDIKLPNGEWKHTITDPKEWSNTLREAFVKPEKELEAKLKEARLEMQKELQKAKEDQRRDNMFLKVLGLVAKGDQSYGKAVIQAEERYNTKYEKSIESAEDAVSKAETDAAKGAWFWQNRDEAVNTNPKVIEARKKLDTLVRRRDTQINDAKLEALESLVTPVTKEQKEAKQRAKENLLKERSLLVDPEEAAKADLDKQNAAAEKAGRQVEAGKAAVNEAAKAAKREVVGKISASPAQIEDMKARAKKDPNMKDYSFGEYVPGRGIEAKNKQGRIVGYYQ